MATHFLPKLMSGEIRVKDAEKMAGSIAFFTITLIIRHRIYDSYILTSKTLLSVFFFPCRVVG